MQWPTNWQTKTLVILLLSNVKTFRHFYMLSIQIWIMWKSLSSALLLFQPAVQMAALLLLLFVPFALCCETLPNDECKKVSFVPGHNLVGEGFDVVRLTTTGAFVVDVQTYMTGGKHGHCTVCENKLLNEKQKLPASVVDWRTKVLCHRSLSSRVYESASSVLKETSNSLSVGWKVGLGVPLVASAAVAGTLSMSAKFAKSHQTQDKYSFTSHSFSCKYYS